MDYTTPIINRNLNDIIVKNPRAFFKITDWERINNNTLYAVELLYDVKGITAQHDDLTLPIRTDKPHAEDINKLVQNINYVRIVANLIESNNYTLFSSYENGSDKLAPDYTAVNNWERVLYIIINRYLTLSAGRLLVTGVGRCGSSPTLQNYFRRYSKRVVGRMLVVGVGRCGSDLIIQNYFRR